MSDRRVGEPSIPHQPEPPSPKEKEVDPEKFKKILKVDESDESQKRRKRHLKKTEEEGVEENPAPESTPRSGFSDLMSSGEKKESILESTGGVRKKRISSTSSYQPSPSKNLRKAKVGSSEAPPPDVQEEKVSSPSPSSSEAMSQISEPSPSIQETAPRSMTPSVEEEPRIPSSSLPSLPSGQVPKTTEGAEQQESNEEQQSSSSPSDASLQKTTDSSPPTKGQQKKNVADESLLASQTKRGALKRKKPKKKDPATVIIESPPQEMPKKKGKGGEVQEEPLSVASSTKESLPSDPSQENQVEEQATLPPPTKPETPFQKLPPETVREQKIALTTESKQKGFSQNKKNQEESLFPEATEETAGIPLPLTADAPLSIPQSQPPAYTTLPSQVHELFEKVGGMMIVQTHSGIETTTVNLHMPDTVFNNAQIVLNRYSTAPNAFNVQLIGSPQAVELFSKNLSQLSESFKQSQYNFEVNLLTPILQTEGKKPLIRRKQASGDKGGGGSKQRGKQ